MITREMITYAKLLEFKIFVVLYITSISDNIFSNEGKKGKKYRRSTKRKVKYD